MKGGIGRGDGSKYKIKNAKFKTDRVALLNFAFLISS
jgi:hypothetical protein